MATEKECDDKRGDGKHVILERFDLVDGHPCIIFTDPEGQTRYAPIDVSGKEKYDLVKKIKVMKKLAKIKSEMN